MSFGRFTAVVAIVLTSSCAPNYAPPQACAPVASLTFRHDLSGAHILRKIPSLRCESSENIQGKPFSQSVTVPIAADRRAYFLVIRERSMTFGPSGSGMRSGCRDMVSFEPRAGEEYTIFSGVCTSEVTTKNGAPPPDLLRHEVPHRCMDNI
jgi:hypothetical protein